MTSTAVQQRTALRSALNHLFVERQPRPPLRTARPCFDLQAQAVRCGHFGLDFACTRFHLLGVKGEVGSTEPL
eukprot:CAMPEP_0180829720 /NCGR_PEP_ID=MMETSP1038_2-20121128/75418_1 /TAXON_ID=632150 /ORGANISM="Azadinium spinosum, Strain 3D9" /LENGTH=72 /DNA_ID=CAMNT_0022872795 /DNA_START=127 /DNA_END=345 /DNA_ORIENTATION=+